MRASPKRSPNSKRWAASRAEFFIFFTLTRHNDSLIFGAILYVIVFSVGWAFTILHIHSTSNIPPDYFGFLIKGSSIIVNMGNPLPAHFFVQANHGEAMPINES
jgi:hypothetical protein